MLTAGKTLAIINQEGTQDGKREAMEKGLNNNKLKLLALGTMTVDHVGLVLFPETVWMRLVGRLAFPIFAYMIAEGCRYTRSMPRYFATLSALAALCQVVYFFAMGSLYQSIMVTFTLSVGLIWLLKQGQKTGKTLWWVLGVLGSCGAFFVAEILPQWLSDTDFYVDYGFLGIMLPVGVYLCKAKGIQLLYTALVLALMSLTGWVGQWVSLLTVPLLALYNGRRGKWNMKWLFYLYYPLHLVAIQAIAYCLAL